MRSHFNQLGWAWIAVLWCTPVLGQTRGGQVPLYVEYSPAAQELADQATRLRQQDRCDEAAEVYQQLLEEYGRKLLSGENEIYTDVTLWVRGQLASDPATLASYRRLYGAAADHRLAQAGALTSDPMALERVLSLYPQCEAAMQAGLRLAGAYLEQGRFAHAGSVLDELIDHPDLARYQTRWHRLQAATGLFSGDPDRYRSHLATLTALTDHPAIEELEAWSRGLRPPTPVTVHHSGGVLPAMPLPESISAPLWSRAHAEPLPLVANGMTRLIAREHGAYEPGTSSSTLPVAVDDDLYLNEWSRIIGVDRSSGRTLWSYPPMAVDGLEVAPTALTLATGSTRVPASVVIAGRRLIGVIEGPPMGHRAQGRQLMGSSTLVCLDRNEGQLLWKVTIDDLDPSLTHTFFYHCIAAQAGHVYVLLQRTQPSGFQDIFVAAVELETGQLVWRRHLTSASTTLAALRQITVSIDDQSGLYVADNLGAVAAIQGRSGAIRWVALLEDRPDTLRVTKAQAHPTMSMRQWSPPVLVAAGLVTGPLVGLPDCYLFDPDTGQRLRRLDGEAWEKALYLKQVGGDVLIIGQHVLLMDGKTLEPRWDLGLGTMANAVPHGRAAVTEDRILIPTRDEIVVIDLATGAVPTRHRVEEPGHVLALPHEIVVASASMVRGYLSWGQAHKRLKRQIALRPHDPRPGLALAQIALAADQDDAVLAGIDHALAAAEAAPIDPEATLTPPHLFQELLDFVKTSRTPRVSLRRKIFDRLASVTTRAEDEAAYQLALAGFLVETGQPNEAVDHYQAVLTDPDLSSQPYQHGSGSSQAGFEAKWRLKKLIQQYGQGIYARHEAMAAQRLAELTHREHLDPQALVEVARVYPLSRTAPKALSAAADGLFRSGDAAEAVTLLRRAYTQTSQLDVLAGIVGRIVRYYEQQRRPAQAARWLARAARDYPQLRPVRDGVALEVEQWLTELSEQFDITTSLPSLALPLQEPFEVPGRLLTPTHQLTVDWPRDFVVVQTGTQIQLRAGMKLEKQWGFKQPSPGVELLAATEEQVLLWDPTIGSLTALETRTGEMLWNWLNVTHQLGAAGDGADALNRRRRVAVEADAVVHMRGLVRQASRRHNSRILLAMNEMVVCLASDVGQVIGIDRYTGELLWRADCPLAKIQSVEMNESSVALTGQRGTPSSRRQGTLMVLDAFTGEARLPLHDDPQQIRWVRFCGADHLVFCGTSRVVMFNVHDGDIAWWKDLKGQRFASQGYATEDLLLLLLWEMNGTILVFDPSSGQIVNRIGLPSSGQRQTGIDFRPAPGGHVHVLSPMQAMAVDRDGLVTWRDAISHDEAKALQLQLVGDDHVLLIHEDSPDPRQAAAQENIRRLVRRLGIDRRRRILAEGGRRLGGRGYSLFVLDRENGAILHDQKIEPRNMPIDSQRAVLLDNRVVLSTGTGLIVVPGHSEGR